MRLVWRYHTPVSSSVKLLGCLSWPEIHRRQGAHTTAIAALLAALHVSLTPFWIAYRVIYHGFAGVVFGWLYWRRGLLSAMMGHFAADVVLAVLNAVLAVLVIA